MRRVLEGCMYDSSTSEQLACVANTDDLSLSCARRETLYRKRNGQYWLYGEGGGGTEYGHTGPSGKYVPGCKIIPLGEKEAKIWCEDNLDGDAYEAIWGPVSEDMPVPEVPEASEDSDWDPEKYII